MIFNQSFLGELTEKAKANPRLRQGFDLPDSENDTSQRMLNAMEPGTVLPVHRHRGSSEIVIVIRGAIEEIFYYKDGNEIKKYTLDIQDGVKVLQVPGRQWYKTVSLKSRTVIFETKNGSYQPLDQTNIFQQ